MKIKADLTKLDTEADVLALRTAAVALLCSLPQDEAEMAVDEWQAVLRVRRADADETSPVNVYVNVPDPVRSPEPQPSETGASEPDGEISPESDPSGTAASEPDGEISPGDGRGTAGGSPGDLEPKPEPEAKGSSYASFTFDGRKFSARKRGPKAAFDHAVKTIRACGSLAELEGRRDALSNLCGILLELDRQELIDALNAAAAEARAGLEARDDQDGRAVPEADTSGGGSDIAPPQPSPEPGVEEAESDTSEGQSDTIPFDLPTPPPHSPHTAPIQPEYRAGSPTPRASNGGAPAPEEPLKDLMRRAMDVIGRKACADIVEHHGAERISELDELSAAAVRRDVLSAMEAAP